MVFIQSLRSQLYYRPKILQLFVVSKIAIKCIVVSRRKGHRPHFEAIGNPSKAGYSPFFFNLYFCRFGADFLNVHGAVIPRVTSNAAFHNIFWSVTLHESEVSLLYVALI